MKETLRRDMESMHWDWNSSAKQFLQWGDLARE